MKLPRRVANETLAPQTFAAYCFIQPSIQGRLMAVVVLAVNWTAVGVVVAVLSAAVAVITKLLLPAWQKLRDPSRIRREASDAYEAQLKVAAKAIDDAAAERLPMTTAQNELNELSKREETLRREFGHGSAVHWIARINREILRRAFDIVRMNSSDPWLKALIRHGVDEAGLRAFEDERDHAIGRRGPVLTFATPVSELQRLADLAQLSSPYDEQFENLLADQQPTTASAA
jgi:hypothetical protein